MDPTVLVDQQIKAGKRLLEELEKSGDVGISAAWWQRTEEPGPWTLYIAASAYNDVGPRETYRRIRDVLAGNHLDALVDLASISVLDPNDFHVTLLRGSIGDREGFVATGGMSASVGPAHFDNIYFYRIRPKGAHIPT